MALPVASPPGPPTGVKAIPGDASATVSFVAPTFDGGATITAYTVTAHDVTTGTSSHRSAPSSPAVITGLRNGDRYSFTVTATNRIGSSAPSAPSAVIVPAARVAPLLGPAAPPDAVVGEVYAYRFVASGRPTPTFAVVSGRLPPGLALSGTSGTVSGAPSRPGLYAFTVQAASAAGSDTATVAIHVAAPPLRCAAAGGTAAGRGGCTTDPPPGWGPGGTRS